MEKIQLSPPLGLDSVQMGWGELKNSPLFRPIEIWAEKDRDRLACYHCTGSKASTHVVLGYLVQMTRRTCTSVLCTDFGEHLLQPYIVTSRKFCFCYTVFRVWMMCKSYILYNLRMENLLTFVLSILVVHYPFLCVQQSHRKAWAASGSPGNLLWS